MSSSVRPNLILDTNALIDFSMPMVPSVALSPEETQLRIDRARDACLLAISLHKKGLTTLSMQNELMRAMFDGSESLFNRQPTEVRPTLAQVGDIVARFVKPYIFKDWKIEIYDEGELGNKEGDTWCLETARSFGVPLITSDGTRSKPHPQSLINRCKAKGVQVFTPVAYYMASRGTEKEDLTWFLNQYVEQMPAFLDLFPTADREWWRGWLNEVGEYLYTGLFNHAAPHHLR